MGSCLNKFSLSGVSLKKHFTGTHPLFNRHSALLPLLQEPNETASIPSTAVRPFSNPTALLPRVEEKATDLAYFDYAILPISKEEEVAPPTTTDSIAGDLANNDTPNLKSYNRG